MPLAHLIKPLLELLNTNQKKKSEKKKKNS